MRQILLAVFAYCILNLFIPKLWEYLMSSAPKWVIEGTMFVAVLACIGFVAFADPVFDRLKSPASNPISSTLLTALLAAGVIGAAWWIFVVSHQNSRPPTAEAAPSLTLAVVNVGKDGKMESNIVSLLGTSPNDKEPPIDKNAAFSARIETVANCSNEIPTGWFATESHRAPIYGWIMIQFTNRSSKPMMIDSYLVERKTDEKAPWERVSLKFGLMKGTSFNGSDAAQVRTIKCTSFDEVITNKTLGAGEPIRGWIALRQPHKFGRLRLTVDTGDGWYTEELRNRLGKGVGMQPVMFDLIPYEKPIDISGRELMSDAL